MMKGYVKLPIEEYNNLFQDSIELVHSNSIQENLLNYQDRLEKAIIKYIAKEIHYGVFDYKLRDEFSEIASILQLYDMDWEKLRPEEEGEEEE